MHAGIQVILLTTQSVGRKHKQPTLLYSEYNLQNTTYMFAFIYPTYPGRAVLFILNWLYHISDLTAAEFDKSRTAAAPQMKTYVFLPASFVC